MNLIRADLYRIFRGKGIYITFASLLASNFFIVVVIGFIISFTADMITNDPFIAAQMEEAMSGMQEIMGEMPEEVAAILEGAWPDTVWEMTELLIGGSNNLIFFLLPLLIFISGVMFDYGTVKNTLARGMCRVKLYFSKLILSAIFTLVLLLFYMSTGMFMAFLMGGLSTPLSETPWADLFQTLVIVYIILFAVACIGTFIIFVTRRIGMTIGIYIAFFIATQLVFVSIASIVPGLGWLAEFDLSFSLQRLSNFLVPDPIPSNLIMTLGVSVFYIVVSTALGIVLFRKAEIK